jgi:putative phosphoribosyl transferase
LLVDLLSEDEATDRRHVFDVAMLAGRLESATRWLAARDDVRGMDVGYYGTRTGAAAALWAAASPQTPVFAIVSRSGRPDLAMPRLHAVRAPTLLIVGGRDAVALELNRGAARHLPCPHEIAVVPEATHVFAEPGAPEQVGQLSTEWFLDHLARRDGDPTCDRSTTATLTH